MTKEFDFKKTLSSRAYTLMVCWRWKKIDEEVFGNKKYRKRDIKQIQESENLRLKMHKGAIEELTRIEGFKEEESIKMLVDECERLIKEKVRDTKEDEMFCGCCRVILKNEEWEKHKKDNKLLHDYLEKELTELSKQQTLMIMSIAEDKKNKK